MIEMKNLRKVYQMGKVSLEALKGISLNVEPGEFVSIMGPSGSGKSTLMNIIGCLDTPTDGSYFFEEKNVAGFSFDQLSSIRNRKIGFVFQNFNLLPYATAYENVELPMLFNGKPGKKRRQRVLELLEMVGLVDWQGHRPTELSGGQQQRVAIARALVNNPSIILADEPTGNLDSKSGAEVMAILQWLNRYRRITVVLVTHDPRIAQHTNRIIHLYDGLITEEEAIAEPLIADAGGLGL